MIPGRCTFLRESATIPARLTVANGRIILFFRGERSMKDSAERRFDGRVHAAVAPRVAPRDPSTLDACMACTRERARKETRHDAFMPRARASAAGYTCAAYLGQRNALMHVPGGRSRAKDPLFALFAGPVSMSSSGVAQIRYHVGSRFALLNASLAEMRAEHRVIV